MRQNTPILAVLLAGLVLAAGVVGVASLREGEPGPEDVAIRVDGVEVTFAELDLRRDASAASLAIQERLIEGEDFGLPKEQVEQQRMVLTLFAPLAPFSSSPIALVAGGAAMAAAEANAPTLAEAEIAAQAQTQTEMRNQILARDEPLTSYPRAIFSAQREALGPDRYEAYLRLAARDHIVRDALVDHLDLSASEAGILPFILGMETAVSAELWIHPSLGVSVDEVRDYLEEQVRFQKALLQLQEELADGNASATED